MKKKKLEPSSRHSWKNTSKRTVVVDYGSTTVNVKPGETTGEAVKRLNDVWKRKG